MKNKIKKHIAYYISLLIILLSGLVLIILTSPNLRLQTTIALLTICFYVLWGTIHQLINHELTIRIMVEYILIGLLGASIIFFMIMGGLI